MQYYHCKEGTSQNGVYISKDKKNLASQLAQKTYDEKIVRYADRIVPQLDRLLKTFEDDRIEKIYIAEHLERQKLIKPIEPTYEQKLAEWLSRPYTGKAFNDDAMVILTNSGKRVRSKSEKIMADYFESLGIIYKYECPLQLKPYGTIYPDFTFLSKRTGKEIYWEHEGMLDNPEYARTAVQKIELYEKNDIFPGENLILTFESSSAVLNTEILKNLTKRYLL